MWGKRSNPRERERGREGWSLTNDNSRSSSRFLILSPILNRWESTILFIILDSLLRTTFDASEKLLKLHRASEKKRQQQQEIKKTREGERGNTRRVPINVVPQRSETFTGVALRLCSHFQQMTNENLHHSSSVSLVLLYLPNTGKDDAPGDG